MSPRSHVVVKMIENERITPIWGQPRAPGRQHQQQARRHFQEAAEHEKQGVDRQQKLPGRELMAEQKFDKAAGAPDSGQPVSDRERRSR